MSAVYALGAVGALAAAALGRRGTGSRATRCPFLFGKQTVTEPDPSLHSSWGAFKRTYWELPPDVIAATLRRTEEPPTHALVFAHLAGTPRALGALSGVQALKRAIGVFPLAEVDSGWRTAYITLEGRPVFGEIKDLPVRHPLGGPGGRVVGFELPERANLRHLAMRRISDTLYRPGSAARSPIRKAAIAKGDLLYHGTGAREDFTHPDAPAWFTQVEATAEWFTGWSDGPRPRVLSFRATRRIPNLLLMRSSDEMAAVMEHLVPYDPPEDPQSMSEAVCDAGYAGWRIPGNYPDGGDDILICDDRVIESLEPVGVRRLPRSRR